MRLVPRSLEARLIGVSLLWIVLALGAAAYVLAELYQNHVEDEHAERIGGYLEELAAALDVSSGGALVLQRDLSDPLFRRPYSGLYWEVFVDGRTVLRSRSLWDQSIGIEQFKVESGGPVSLPGPDRQQLSAWAKTIRHPHHPRPITMLVAADRSRIESMASSFARTLAVSLAILALGLGAVVVAQVQIGLAPLRRLGRTITELREGNVDRVEGDFPSEVRPLVEDLNAVLNENRELLARARAQAGNLAHALKTPLAVIRNSLVPSGTSSTSAAMSAEVERMHQAIERHLVRARAGSVHQHGRRVLVRTAVEDVTRAIGRMYGDKVRIELAGDSSARFRGDASDLQEILGNLLDNAAKWARSQVRVDLRATEGRVEITIEDDGPGIPLQRRAEAIQRGVRLDTTRPGSGLGLQIVDELCRIYEGSLELGDSSLGGLAARVILPGQ